VNAGSGAVINSSGAFVGAGVDVGAFGVGCGYMTTNGGELDCGLLRSNNNIVASNSVNPTTLSGTGWLVGDQIASVSSVGCASLDVSGHEVINVNGAFIGSGIDIRGYGASGTGGIACFAIESFANPNQPGTGYIIADNYLYSRGWVYGTEYHMSQTGGAVIDGNGRFVGAGVDVTATYGIGCGYLTTYGGRVDTGSINCAGLITCGGLNDTGSFGAADFTASGIPVINNLGQFIGHGIAIQGQGIGCSYLQLYGGNIDGVGNITVNGLVNCGDEVRAAHWITCAGWAVSDYNHNVYFGQLFANYWSGSQPVINTAGQFVGPGIQVHDNGIGCGYLSTRYHYDGQGGIDTGYISALSWITANGVITGNSGFNTSGGTVINGSGQFVGYGFSVNGQCYTGSTMQANGGYYGGPFYGNGIQCPGYGVGCAGVNVYYGGVWNYGVNADLPVAGITGLHIRGGVVVGWY
jgi:hypothetical protein